MREGLGLYKMEVSAFKGINRRLPRDSNRCEQSPSSPFLSEYALLGSTPAVPTPEEELRIPGYPESCSSSFWYVPGGSAPAAWASPGEESSPPVLPKIALSSLGGRPRGGGGPPGPPLERLTSILESLPKNLSQISRPCLIPGLSGRGLAPSRSHPHEESPFRGVSR